MKKSWLVFYLIFPVLFSGCYEEKVKEAASKLQIGMSKAQLEAIVKELKFIKEQTVTMYPNSNEEQMRASLANNKNYEYQTPENLIDILTFDGNIKVYSYLIRKDKVYANPPTLRYLAIFYNQKEDKIIGWAQMRTSGDIDSLRDKF